MSFNIFSDQVFVPDNHALLANKNKYLQTFRQGGFYNESLSKANSQKARGVFFLMGKQPVLQAAFGLQVPKHILFDAGEVFSDSNFNFPVFARPCPSVPRHGFVDSVLCNNSQELNRVSEEAKQAESNAELLITKPIPASYNAIITDGVITFSYGNDGATAGRDIKYFYISQDPIAPIIELDTSLMLNGEVPFYELVLDQEGTTFLVQVRSAPGVPKCKDYVPEKTEVKTIIKAEGDLLEWEALLKTVDPRTTIIDHTNGSLASHYAIHAIINRIPIFTSYLPNQGDILEPTVTNSEITEEDREKFYRAFCYGFSSGKFMTENSKLYATNHHGQMTSNLILALSTLHNFSAISMAKDYEVLGITLGLFLRTTFAVSIGEARFAHMKPEYAKEIKDFHAAIPKSRGGAYEWAWKMNAGNFISNIRNVYRIFDEVKWQSSYGGAKWLSCTKSSINLFNACVAKDVFSVVELFNKVLHEEHNSGKYLNKIINTQYFDEAASNPSQFAVKNIAHIIDMLSTVWKFAKESDVSSIPWNKFKPLDFYSVSPTMEPNGRWAIRKILANVNSSKSIANIEVWSDKFEGSMSIPLDKWNYFPDLNSNHKYDLSSAPYKWIIKIPGQQDKTILTKNWLNNYLDQNLANNS